MRLRVAEARSARLATVGEDGLPHLVPIVFSLDHDLLWTAVDHKPKRTLDLVRLRNVRAHPPVCVLVDHYESDWERLWWVRLDGTGRVIEDEPGRRGPVDALRRKYAQHEREPPEGPVIEIAIQRWSGWAASESA